MTTEIEFKAKVAKYRRINIPKPFFQIKDGDEVIVRIEILQNAEATV